MDNLDNIREKLIDVVNNASNEELQQLVINLGLGSKTNYEYVMCFAGEVDEEVIGYIKDDINTVIDFYSQDYTIDSVDAESFIADFTNIIESYLPLLVERNYREYADDLNQFIQSRIRKLKGAINRSELLAICQKYDVKE